MVFIFAGWSKLHGSRANRAMYGWGFYPSPPNEISMCVEAARSLPSATSPPLPLAGSPGLGSDALQTSGACMLPALRPLHISQSVPGTSIIKCQFAWLIPAWRGWWSIELAFYLLGVCLSSCESHIPVLVSLGFRLLSNFSLWYSKDALSVTYFWKWS